MLKKMNELILILVKSVGNNITFNKYYSIYHLIFYGCIHDK